MARIVLISPYLKGGQNAAKLAQRTRYVATDVYKRQLLFCSRGFSPSRT